jgi:short-subunit dehydrogenase
MLLGFAHKTVLITGSSSGIGLALSRKLVALGCNVAGIGLDASSPLSDPRYTYMQGDICIEAARASFIEGALERFGTVDILINNAAIGIYAPSTETSEEELKKIYGVNVFAGLELIKRVVPIFRKNHGGSIVNIGSICGSVTVPWSTIYCSTKFAVHGITQGLRRELAGDNIHVMLVMPAVIATDFRKHVLRGIAPGKVKDIELTPPEKVADDIIRGLARKKKHVYSPLHLAFPFMKMQEYAPWLMDWYLKSKQ